jgi:hypothetical protein
MISRAGAAVLDRWIDLAEARVTATIEVPTFMRESCPAKDCSTLTFD